MKKILFMLTVITVFLYADMGAKELKEKLESMHLSVSDEMLNSNAELIELLINSESTEMEDKKQWLHKLPTLTNEEIARLTTILKDEKRKLAALDEKYAKEKYELSIKQAKELIEKIYEFVNTEKNSKLTNDELFIGAEAIATYLKDDSSTDKQLLSKSSSILEYILQDKTLSDAQKAKLYYLSYKTYLNYNDFAKLDIKSSNLKQSIVYLKKINNKENNNTELKDGIAELLGALSYLQVCKKEFEEAVKSADESISFSKQSEIIANVNKAHALMFLGKTEEAKITYQKALTSEMKNDVKEAILGDLKEFEMLKLPKEAIDGIRAIIEKQS